MNSTFHVGRNSRAPVTAEKRLLIGMALWAVVAGCAMGADPYVSPECVSASPDGAWLALCDVTRCSLVLLDGAASSTKKVVSLKGTPRGVVWHKGLAYVSEYDAGTVAEIDPTVGSVKRRITVGPKPWGLAVAPAAGHLLVVEFGLGRLLVMDMASGGQIASIPVLGLPRYAAVSPDGATCLVVNSNPVGDARKGTHACAVSIVDLKTLSKTSDVAMPPGSINPRGVAISPDGKWAYVVHGLGRFTLPTTQLERGWVMTNGMTVFDLARREVHATVLLDTISHGSADPWGMALTADGSAAWITVAGCNELLHLDMGLLHALLDGKAAAGVMAKLPGGSAWTGIAKNPTNRLDLVNDLAALHVSGVKTTMALPGKGPRGVAVLSSGNVAVAEFFSGTLAVGGLSVSNSPVSFATVSLGAQPQADAARRGETAFHSGDLCFQRWLSCASCHPEGRADGLNWDLLNDGMGNPKNTKSLVWSHKTPPVMAHGVRDSMETATKTGFMFIQFRVVDEAVMEDVRTYLRSIEPEKSPYLENGKLSAMARKGKAIFEDERIGCARCHSAPLFTDMKMYDVGTAHELDSQSEFDNPTCVEMWRSGPYLHDGSAATMAEMLTTMNPEDRHGKTSKLSKEELDALVAYVLSL